MNNSLVTYFKQNILKSNVRSIVVAKHIGASFIYKAVLMVIGFYTVRINLAYLGKEAYGIWITVYSVVFWMEMFDFGFGNGLRNKLAECIAKNETQNSRIYVSTTYASVTLISVFYIFLFFVLLPFIDFTKVFNISKEYSRDINLLVIWIYVSFSLRFVLKLITSILNAQQKASYRHLFDLISKGFSLILIIYLMHNTSGSLVKIGIVYSVIPLMVFLIASIVFFIGKNKNLRPTFKYVDFSYLKDIMSLGIKFFIIRLSIIVMFSTDNLIIAHIFSPADVTTYHLPHRFFGSIKDVSLLIFTPLWSAYTDAYFKKDFQWIKKSIKMLNLLWLGFVVVSLLAILISPYIYDFFDKNNYISVPQDLTIAMAIWTILAILANNYLFFINGTGKIKFQFYGSIIGAVVNIPLSIFFARNLGLGLSGVIVATMVSYSYAIIGAPIQYKYIINNKKGIFFN